jgi:hypothetical protein
LACRGGWGRRSSCVCGCGGVTAVESDLRVGTLLLGAPGWVGGVGLWSGWWWDPGLRSVVQDRGAAFGCGFRALRTGAAGAEAGPALWVTDLFAVRRPGFLGLAVPRPRVPLGVPRGMLFGLVMGPGIRAVAAAVGGRGGRWFWFLVPVGLLPCGVVPG